MEFDLQNIRGIYIDKDYSKAESCGTENSFQIISVVLKTYDGENIDVTEQLDNGHFYESDEEIVDALGLNPNTIEYDHLSES